MVRLKLDFVKLTQILYHCFNSTMVRLKHFPAGHKSDHQECFNSTMVRLKREVKAKDKMIINLFQFHNGSIKTIIVVISSLMIVKVSIPQWFD